MSRNRSTTTRPARAACALLAATFAGSPAAQAPPPVYSPPPAYTPPTPAPAPAPAADPFAPAPPPPPVYTPPPAFPPPAGAPVDPFAPAPLQPPAFDPFQATAAPAAPFAPQPAPSTSIRKVFAGTVAAAAAATGVTLIAGLTQAITGGITSWFSRRQSAPQAAAPAAMPPAPLALAPAAGAPAYPPPAVPDSAPAQTAYAPPDPALAQPVPVAPAYGAATAPPAYAAAATPSYFDAQTGTTATADPAFAAAASGAAPGGPGLFAGIAYEVHAMSPGGASMPVDPATHEFRTGERFVVHYRPALPGRMDVFNINPAGQQTLIDSAELAAGQLATLGPYEFAAMKGDERLRLVLTPCSTPRLLTATRDIVNVSSTAAAAPGLGMPACGPATRSIDAPVTRDIRKVALEGTTAFALDPVSAHERESGRVAPREVTILFRHR